MTLQAFNPTEARPAPSASAQPVRQGRSSFLARLRREDSGQDVIEYALAAALIGLSAVSTASGLALDISNTISGIGSSMANAVPADTGSSGNSGGNSGNNGSGNSGSNNGGHHHHGGNGGWGGGGGGWGGWAAITTTKS